MTRVYSQIRSKQRGIVREGNHASGAALPAAAAPAGALVLSPEPVARKRSLEDDRSEADSRSICHRFTRVRLQENSLVMDVEHVRVFSHSESLSLETHQT